MFSKGVRLWQTSDWRKLMKLRTIYLPILCVLPGMTLALPITDRAGRTLFAAGTVLDAVMLDRLNKRGIESVAAQVADTRDAATIEEEVRVAAARVQQIFRGHGSATRGALQSVILNYREEGAR
jgi:hypothetical protein